jgi:hypothetical protein
MSAVARSHPSPSAFSKVAILIAVYVLYQVFQFGFSAHSPKKTGPPGA